MNMRPIVEAAQALMTAAGLAQTVTMTDIRDQASMLVNQYADYSDVRADKIAEEISKEINRRPGFTVS